MSADTTWADRAEAILRDSSLQDRPHLVLACGHLSPPGSGPLAESGRGWCFEDGVQRIAASKDASSG